MLTVPAELATENERLGRQIDALLDVHGHDQSALIPVLQDLRASQHEISDLAMQIVADRLHLPVTEVQGVVTFYAFLQTAKTGERVIRLCRTLSCEMAGMKGIADQLQKELGVPFGGTTADGKFTLEWANCIGRCEQAPAMLVDFDAVGSLTPARVTEIIAALRAEGAK